MSVEKLIEENQNIQVKLLNFLDNDFDDEINYQDLTLLFNEQRIQDNKQKLILLLSLLVSISNNHCRSPNFWDKIEKILLLFKNDIKKLYSNKEIFKIFNKNKRILLFIIKEQILTVDLDIAKLFISRNLIKNNYIHYFSFEIKPFENELYSTIDHYEKINKQENSYNERNEEKNFYSPNFSVEFNNTVFSKILEEKYSEDYRKSGENESEISELIRKDSIKDFIVYINKNNLSLKSTIKPSIYETNSFLINKELSLLEYAVFNGSHQIFNYLRLNNVELTPSLWIYAIHGNNSEIIRSLEENKIIPKDKSYKKLFIESIKCHHNDVAKYIQQNYLENNDIDNDEADVDEADNDDVDDPDNYDIDNDFVQFLKYYNFQFVQKEYFDENSIIYLLSYNYTSFLCSILQQKSIDINRKIFKNLRFEYPKNIIEVYHDGDGFIYRNEYEKTLLYVAVENENIDIIKLLLNDDNLDINEKCEEFNSKYEIKKYYVDAPPNESLRTIKTAFYAAVEKENIEIIELLLSNSRLNVNTPCIETKIKTGEKRKYETTPLYEAIKIGNIDIIKLLLKNDKLDINIINKKQHKKLLVEGSESRTDFESKEKEKTALYKAIEEENIEIIKLLLSNDKLNVNIPYIEEILNTSQYIDDDTAFLKKEERRTKEITSLFTAVQHRNIEIIKLLLENGNLDINFVNRYREDYYPDQMYGRYDEIKMISYAKTALYAAVDKKMIDIVKLLLSFNKININYINKEGNQAITSLHKAVQKNYLEIVEILLANKNIDINIKDDKGKTPIYYANNEKIKKIFDH